MLGVVDQVHVGEEHQLGRGGHMGLAGEDLSPVFWGVYDQWCVAVVPVGRLLVLGVAVGMDLLAVRGGIEGGMDRILRPPALEARSAPSGALEEGGLVIAGPGAAPAARDAEVAGQHEGKVER